ncbi:bifunctional (p)ppGpp synthetase/guanosine-3',5'-bis(diphosphate) 3'-pyrophosphohydrolase [Candidatus Peregrinibacteria bacterium]|nr:bifunctional (p)ppGpp synthetase/guanosine-3',5'-bis(diphosphate) 3'-pyrophosphohydrolase [Candidatus Peregrinibacteria bacterium]
MKTKISHIHTIKGRLHACRHHDLQCLSDLKALLEKRLLENKINASISHRVKDTDSMVYKIKRKQCKFHEICDRLGMRIIVGKVEDCYKVLHICKDSFLYGSESIKDYIISPKQNGYQSLHILINPPCSSHDQCVEVQIRTWDMHCEYLSGRASHDNYKKEKYGVEPRLNQRKTKNPKSYI